MLDFVSKGLTKILGSKSDSDLKKLRPFVGKINAEFDKLGGLSNDELRNKTVELKSEIADRLKDIDDKISAIEKEIETNESLSVADKDDKYSDIDALEKKRDEQLEEVLIDILPKAFAVVKETAKRFKDNEKVIVSATDLDREFAAAYDNVEIEGDQSVWHNSWKAAGVDVKWEMMHYDVQLIGGVVLHQGKIAEMATGEGKTLVATLPAYLNAIAGRGVHIVTVNDYLAKRDSEWMAPIFMFHGMKVDCIDKHRPNSFGRRQAYNADITYGTNNEFGFDYLRDNMAHSPGELVQRKHHFAMVDEVDSVLIDDARTPLIISGPVPKGDQHEFAELKPWINRVVEEQRKVCSAFLIEAKKLIKEGNEKEGGLSLFRAYRGLPKSKPLIKYLGETGMRQLLQKTENIYLAENQKLMPEADEPLYFTIDEQNNSIDLTDRGLAMLTSEGDDPNFFILPDISTEIDRIEKSDSMSDEEKAETKDALIGEYSDKSQRIHSVSQLLKAYTLFEKDVDYIVQDSKVMIVDEQTGRVMDGRRYSDGLHMAIEAKENVKVEDATQTYATVTLQNYFRMYHKLAGMTGTAETEAGEFMEIYELDVVVIPTNKPISRDDQHDKVYKTVREKFNAVIEETVELSEAGRPILIGTTSVEISEVLSRMLKIRNIKHQVLNAKQHASEAEVVAEAGKPGTVTIATNMAGRGTDIKLTPESKAAGGLAIIGTERHESRRVDRQLRGRAGRQGDVGSSQFYVSLEDNLMRLFGSDRISKVMDRLGLKEGEVIQHSMISKSIERAQKKVEENNFAMRKRLLEYDDVMNSQREVIYKRRRNALFGDRLEVDILSVFYEKCEELVIGVTQTKNYDSFNVDVISAFGFSSNISTDELEKGNVESLTDKLFDEVIAQQKSKNKRIIDHTLPFIMNAHEERGAVIENVSIPFTDGKKVMQLTAKLQQLVDTQCKSLMHELQKAISLHIIDKSWTDHLREMDDLKQSVRNAAYEQKDPLVIYKLEGFQLFKSFVDKLNGEISAFLSKVDIHVENSAGLQEARQQQARRELNENKDDVGSALGGGSAPAQNGQPQAHTDTQQPQITQPIKADKVIGRNERVTVQYLDGSTKEGVKYKTVEQDINDNKCVLLESE